MVRTQIQLTEDQAKALKKIASSQHASIAQLVRKAVDAMIKTSPFVDTAERQKRAIDIAGKFSSGKRDISKKHDAYLDEAYAK
jgi:RecA/RadA recombinase